MFKDHIIKALAIKSCTVEFLADFFKTTSEHVYSELKAMDKAGLVKIDVIGSTYYYVLTEDGQEEEKKGSGAITLDLDPPPQLSKTIDTKKFRDFKSPPKKEGEKSWKEWKEDLNKNKIK